MSDCLLQWESAPVAADHPLLPAVLELARRALPLECVGLLGADSIWPLSNRAASPEDRFELDPLEVAAALSAGFAVHGLYHSHPHPAAAPTPSRHDLCPFLGSGWLYWIVNPLAGSWGRWRWTGATFVPE